MIAPSELRTLERDILKLFEDLVVLQIHNKQGMPDEIFNHKVTARVREIHEICQQIERNSYNRDLGAAKHF